MERLVRNGKQRCLSHRIDELHLIICCFSTGPSLPANLLPTLPHISRILSYLGGLPKSSSHPCSQATHAALTAAKEGYLASRREYVSSRGINPIVREFDHLAEGPMSPGREEEGRRDKCRLIARATEGLMIMIQVGLPPEAHWCELDAEHKRRLRNSQKKISLNSYSPHLGHPLWSLFSRSLSTL
jgi:hypothetical protein